MDNNNDLYEEVRLYRTAQEREHSDNMADLYSIINTLNCLEKAYIKDSVTAKEYTAACSKLLAQYKTAFNLVKMESISFDEGCRTIEDFMKKYNFDCPAAMERIRDGRPITIKDDLGSASRAISMIVQLFITTTDRLRLNIRSKDELQPDLKELFETMNRLTIVPQEFEAKAKINEWLQRMELMAASDELDDEQSRQLIFDLESCYAEFNKLLHEA